MAEARENRSLTVLSNQGLEEVKAALAKAGITPAVQDRKHGGFDVAWENGPSVEDIRRLAPTKTKLGTE
jgi:hypothetical protein